MHLCPQSHRNLVAAVRAGLSEAKTLKKLTMETWMITDPMPTVAKSILANITSPLEELELEWFSFRCEYTHIYVCAQSVSVHVE